MPPGDARGQWHHHWCSSSPDSDLALSLLRGTGLQMPRSPGGGGGWSGEERGEVGGWSGETRERGEVERGGETGGEGGRITANRIQLHY